MVRHLFAELRRRNVFRAAILYIGAVWALAQGIVQLAPTIGAPEWSARWFLVAAALGFPFWIAFAWIYEFTPGGLKRESDVDRSESIARRTGRRFDIAIIGVLALAVVLLLTDRFVLRHGVNQRASEAAAAEPVPVPDKSIAVLPFADMSQAKDQEYFSDGISEELLNLLAKVPGLQVTARTSSFSFKGKGLGIPDIARSLRVSHVLEGSVRKSGDQLRITAQLINAADDTTLWSQTYDRTFEDVFKIQDEIAADVVKNLRINLLGAAPTSRATNPQAYALWLQARQIGRSRTPEAFAKSDDLFHQALAIDPGYAPAWGGLAVNAANRAGLGLLPMKEGYARAREAAEKAIALDPSYAPAYTMRGLVKLRADNAPAEAAKDYERALALDPNDLAVMANSATFLASIGRVEDAVAIDSAAARRDPVNPVAIGNLGSDQLSLGQFAAAAASFRRMLDLSPDATGIRGALGEALLLAGDAAGALAEFEQETTDWARMVGVAMAYHALGRKAEADAALAALIAEHARDAPYNIAYVCAFRGEADAAFAWLDKAIEYEDAGLAEVHTNRFFANVRGDPRWLPFLRKLGQAPEQLAKIQFKVTPPAD